MTCVVYHCRVRLVVVLVAACGQAARPAAPVQAPPPAPAPPPVKVANWYCFTSEPFNAECARDQVTCNADAMDMHQHARTVSACRPAENVFCHQFADDPNAAPLCYPTAEYCETGRKIMEPAGPQSECVATVGGLVPPMKVSKVAIANGGGAGLKWWCFTTEHPYNAECVHEQPHCQRDGADMRGYSGAQVSECFAAETVYCHHYQGSDDPDPLCYPTPEHCENGRDLMGKDSQTPCVKMGR
jgi:hypothetical protein